jgi:PPM family protein phosphatase
MEIATVAHIGGRNEQQDSVTTFSNGKTHLLVVADGMGGHKGGSLASTIVLLSAQNAWKKYQQGKKVTAPDQFLQYICELAHHNINKLGKKHQISPRSTCVLVYIDGKQAWWTHIGDSRLYHFSSKKLLYRTRDHSVVQLLVDLGRITEEEMATHPDQGRLLKGLGGDEPIKPEFGKASLHAGDSLVLCSDGFWEHVSPQQMLERLLQTDFPLKKRVKRLVKDVLDAGGAKGDNIAVAVAQLQGKKSLNPLIYVVLGLIIALLLGAGVWFSVISDQ